MLVIVQKLLVLHVGGESVPEASAHPAPSLTDLYHALETREQCLPRATSSSNLCETCGQDKVHKDLSEKVK